MYLGPARDTDEVVRARLLASSIFPVARDSSAEDSQAYKKFLWAEPDFPGLDHIIVAAPSIREVCGVARLVPRLLRRGDEVFKVAGLSSVCIAEPYRGFGLSRKLLTTALEQARKQGYEIIVLFARHAVNHFYPKFDIWGIASYSKLAIPRIELLRKYCSNTSLRTATKRDIPLMMSWHVSSYSDCFGWIERSQAQWSYLLKACHYRNISLVIGETFGTPIGYAALDGNKVVEIGYTPDQDPILFLATLALSVDFEPWIAEIPSYHNIYTALKGIDFTTSCRACEYGGHMLGVLDPDKVCRHLERRILKRSLALGLSPKTEVLDGLILSWSGENVEVKIDKRVSNLGISTTARLVGARLAGREERSLLAPSNPLDFLTIDQF